MLFLLDKKSIMQGAAWLNKNLVLALPLAMFAGFLYGLFLPTEGMGQAILRLTFLLVLPMMVTFDLRKLLGGGNGFLQFMAQVLNFGIFPFAALVLGRWAFPGQTALQLGLLLSSLLPTSGMTVSWTGLAKGNVPEAVKMTIIGLVLGSLATPFYIQWLMGAQVGLPLSQTFFQILIGVFLPLVLGQALRAFLLSRMDQGHFEKEWKPLFPGLSTLAVLAMVFTALALKSRSLAADPAILWQTFWPVALFYLFNFALSTLVGRLFFRRAEAFALVYGTVMRNLSLSLALAMGLLGASGGNAALVVTWAFVIQVQGAAWYMKLAPRFFAQQETGEKATPAPQVVQVLVPEEACENC